MKEHNRELLFAFTYSQDVLHNCRPTGSLVTFPRPSLTASSKSESDNGTGSRATRLSGIGGEETFQRATPSYNHAL